jgi:hypothetical protein
MGSSKPEQEDDLHEGNFMVRASSTEDSKDTGDSGSYSPDDDQSVHSFDASSLNQDTQEACSSQTYKKSSSGSFRGRGRGRKRSRWSKKRTPENKKTKSFDADLDDEATDIEDIDMDDEEPFEWPTEVVIRNRPMPFVSEQHRERMRKFKEVDIISSDEVYKIMLALDFDHFYINVKDIWIEHNAIILERTFQVIKKGDRILVFPANLYFSVCLALFVGEKGGVVCFGHINNVHILRKCGLDWLMDDYRIRFTNMNHELYYGLDYKDEFLVYGFPKGQPYDAMVMTDAPLNEEIRSQLKPEGIAFRPDLTVHEMFLKGEPDAPLIDPTETENVACVNQVEQESPDGPAKDVD